MKTYGNVCNLIKNYAKEIIPLRADAILKKIENRLYHIDNSDHVYIKAEKNTISILKKIEIEKCSFHNIEYNTLLDQKCIESIIKIHNYCEYKDIYAMGFYNKILTRLVKENIKKISQESEISKREILLKEKENLFNKIENINDKLKEMINVHCKCFHEMTKELKNIDNKTISEKINKYNKYKSEILEKIRKHEIDNKDLTSLTELREYIKELQKYDNNLNKIIKIINNITDEYVKELRILNDPRFKSPDDIILNMLDSNLDELKKMNLQIN